MWINSGVINCSDINTVDANLITNITKWESDRVTGSFVEFCMPLELGITKRTNVWNAWNIILISGKSQNHIINLTLLPDYVTEQISAYSRLSE